MNRNHAVLAALVLALVVFAPLSASAAQGGVLSVPVSGTATSTAPGSLPVQITGVYNITSFAVQGGKLVAVGTLNFAANGVQNVIQTAVQVTQATGACPILNLSIGADSPRPPWPRR